MKTLARNRLQKLTPDTAVPGHGTSESVVRLGWGHHHSCGSVSRASLSSKLWILRLVVWVY